MLETELKKLSKIEKSRRKRPKVRRILDEIGDFCDKVFIVNYIILLVLSALLIGVPTFMVFLSFPEDIRVWITSIFGGILSIIVMPLFIDYIKYKQKINDELYENNKPLYEMLSDILVKLLAEEYSTHKEDVHAELNTSEKQNKIIYPLKKFICENYEKMCNTFPVSLIWDIVDVYDECLNDITKYSNIRAKVRKCFCNMRRDAGAKGSFYINQCVIKMLCSDNNKIDKIYK